MKTEHSINVLGDVISFRPPQPSNLTNNEDLRPKYLTSDCIGCPFFIEGIEGKKIVKKAAENTPHAWVQPDLTKVEGVCAVGKHVKILIKRPRSTRHCSITKDKRELPK